MKLLLLVACSLAAFAQCPLSATTSAGTICLKGDKGDPGIQGPPGATGAPGPAGAGISTITVLPNGDTQVKGNLIVTGAVSTGSGAAAPTMIQITRTDGTTCRVTFSPTNSMIWTCP